MLSDPFRYTALFMLPWALLPSLAVLYLLGWIVYCRTLHPLAKIPGPFLASVSRLWIMHQTSHGKMQDVQRELHRKYGPLIRIAPNEIACADPEAIPHIYRTTNALSKSDFYPVWGNKSFSKYPDHFSTTDEKLHAQRRRIVSHVYSLSNVLRSERYIDNCSNLFMQRVGEFADRGEEFDLGQWLQMYAFDVVGELYFGKMFGFMEHRTDYESYIQSLDALLPVLTETGLAPTYMRPFILGTSLLSPTVRKALKAIDHIAQAARDCVNRRLQALSTGSEDVRTDLLQQLFDISQEKGEKYDFKVGEIQYESYVAIFAGSDTTAIAMRSVIYHLMKNPTVYKEVMAEIDDADEHGLLSNPIQYSEASTLPLLCACIKEAMRLHPSVGLTMPRVAPEGGLVLCGEVIPGGYRVGMNAAVVHHDQRIFGADAAKFRPSRWLTADAKTMDKYMLHFGAGTRTCIGKNISLSELHKLIPQLLRTFDLELATDRPWDTQNFWFNKQTGLITRARRRKDRVALSN
ncbi:hypothetical protein AYO21_06936 [Fonsecaea monophora]|uniref:Cytochrome P450 oxidoreductase n=1 Tax=Fonsecaea monophora TaxID=254056 RepID=A0A177F3M1_9EURO|nr:hypothetical protein AYO21_06936 [Fonsecaea monophora]KAH0841174.1 Pisatin demethylase [Fonsecaea pedrosoi]OAG38905.1 hypothetical protein AYO21_06936 [Fonsecaea monophora]